MRLDLQTYKEKVYACWLGKNIGGTLGAPFEGKRGTFDVDYYTHDLSLGVLPNDDLDLQLIFLLAAEKYGKALRSEHLAEYWLYLVPVDWSEYGQGKNNLKIGFAPPVSGNLHNEFRNSNGCFIRSEIWACLHPGHPELAVKYAYEDGIVDHADEGVYAEVFCAAIESAAFVENDIKALIEIGLSYIPENCAVANAVRFAVECVERGMDWKEARKQILTKYPDTFGLMRGDKDLENIPRGELAFDAPAHMGLLVMAWLEGAGNFDKSICIATGCGEDADCTAGTLASILGIFLGKRCFDEKWLKPIGNEIKTLTIDHTKEFNIPNNIDDLTKRVLNLMPTFMQGYFNCADGTLEIEYFKPLTQKIEKTGWFEGKSFSKEIENSFWTIKRESAAFDLNLTLDSEVLQGKDLNIKVKIFNKFYQQQWIKLSVICCEFDRIVNKFVCVNQFTAGDSVAEENITIKTENMVSGIHDIIVVAESNAKISKIAIPLKFIIK